MRTLEPMRIATKTTIKLAQIAFRAISAWSWFGGLTKFEVTPEGGSSAGKFSQGEDILALAVTANEEKYLNIRKPV
jgi:hypothetical protein